MSFWWFGCRDKRLAGIERNIKMTNETVASLVVAVLNTRRDIMAQIDDLKAAVAENTSVVQSAVVLMDNIAAQLAAALAGGNVSADVQAVIDTIKANSAALAADVAKNTPAAPEPAPAPDVPPTA